MKKQAVPVASRLSGVQRIACITALLFTLDACISSGGGSEPGSSDPDSSTPAIKFLSANDGINGSELWKTDGTALVKNINPATDAGAGSFPSGLTVFNGALYFLAYDGVDGFELWKTEGTPAGTVLVKDINTTTGAGSNPIGFTAFNDGVYGQQLWKTDGTADGTMRVMDINSTAGVGPPFYGFIVFNDAIYFRNDDSVSNYELWNTDGTTAGTGLVKYINAAVGAITLPPVAAESNPYVFIELNGALYFPADDGVNGNNLWKTDGTEAGTQLLKDFCPGQC